VKYHLVVGIKARGACFGMLIEKSHFNAFEDADMGTIDGF
jgi:hypothetical protein